MVNIVCEFYFQNNYVDKEGLWADIVAATDFTVWSTYHTTYQATSGHLVFRCEIIINTPFISDWEAIRRRKQEIIEIITKIKIKIVNHAIIEYVRKY